jgi:hypothetical protein
MDDILTISYIPTENIIQRVYKNLLIEVSKDEVEIISSIDIIKSLWFIVNGFINLTDIEKKALIIHTLNDIAAGKDGILNTKDDIIEPQILYGLQMLIECNMISSTIDLICEVSHIKTTYTYSTYLYKCFAYLCCSCKRNKLSPEKESLLQN